MNRGNQVDYLQDADNENDDLPQSFSIRIPELNDLINEFEKDDDYLYRKREDER